jgi:hypothetical protein
MPSNPTLQQQEDDFDKFRPTLDATEATTPAGPDGEIVSWAVLQAIRPEGVILKLATKTKSFGPFRLTPVAVTKLVLTLNKTPQHL